MAGGRTAVAGRRVWIFASLGLVAVVAFGVYRWALGGPGATAVDGPARRLDAAAIAVVPGIYMLGGLFPSAAYVVVTSEGLILIDSGLASDAGPLKTEMARLGLDWKRVRAILLTHVHGDHSGGAGTLRQETGARVYAGAGDAAVLRAGGPREAFFSTFYMPGHDPHPTTVDVELHGDETIAVGDVRVRAIAAPGHTPGSTCYLAECRGIRALFAGDVIMMLRGEEPPRNELEKPLGTYSAYLAPNYRGDARDSLATLRRLRGLPVPDLVLPGHPRADPMPQSPRLSQARWAEILDRGIGDMETLLARYEADGADFLDGHPKVLLPDLFYLGDRDGSAVYGFFAGPRFFLVDAPGGPGLLDFVNSGLRQVGREPTPPSAVLLTACGPDETAGLKELVEKCHPEVVAASSGIPRIRDVCPPGTVVITPEDLVARQWCSLASIPLEGRGWSPMGYRLTLAGKTILLSGRIPVKLSQAARDRLIADSTHPPGNTRGYFNSLTRLQQAGRPDIWLPAAPTHGQNANLYDQDWTRHIEENRSLIGSLPSRIPPA
jgi:glyoxylase-like metal-dependent hydrolase (beta-lactamase superfamily II)